MKLFRISIKTARGRLYIRLYNALGRFKYNDGYLYSYGKIMVGALCVVDLHSSVRVDPYASYTARSSEL